MTVRNTLRTINGDGDNPTIKDEERDLCPICGGAGWVSKAVPIDHPDFGQAFPCKCQQLDDPASHISALHRYSNLGPLSRITFDNTRIRTPISDIDNQQLFEEAIGFAVEFAEDPDGWLVFVGPSGSGKTHLAVAIANRCIEQGLTTFFIVVADLLDHLRATYSPDNPVSYDELFEQIRNVPLLVLDDLGTHVTSPWAHEKLFQVLNHRFNFQLPTVITVRGQLDELDERLRTRIKSPTGISRVVQLGVFKTGVARHVGDMSSEMQRLMTFDTFDNRGGRESTKEDRESLEKAKEAAYQFAGFGNDQRGRKLWLVLSGPRGCGKTHLAVAIAGEQIKREPDSAFFAFVPTLIDHLGSTFKSDSQVSYDELFERICSVGMLILDDLYLESSIPWVESRLYQIVVRRFEENLPTVITTSLNRKELHDLVPRIASRLVDAQIVNWLPITAPNYRSQRRS